MGFCSTATVYFCLPLGHALGLGHSKRQEAVMNPIYKQLALENVVLDIDDKCAVNWNYSKMS